MGKKLKIPFNLLIALSIIKKLAVNNQFKFFLGHNIYKKKIIVYKFFKKILRRILIK